MADQRNFLTIIKTNVGQDKVLVGAANEIRDQKGQFIHVDAGSPLVALAFALTNISSDSVAQKTAIGCKGADQSIERAQSKGIADYTATVKAVADALKTTHFVGNDFDNIVKAFAPNNPVENYPKSLGFLVEGDVSVLDVVCQSPAIKKIRQSTKPEQVAAPPQGR